MFLRRLGIAFLVAVTVAIVAIQIGAQTTPTTQPVPSPVDTSAFTKLRLDFPKESQLGCFWSTADERDGVLAAYKDKRRADFIKLAEAWLIKCPIDATVHMLLSNELGDTGDFAGYFYHRTYCYGLLASIASGGDGRSKKSAMKVVAVTEEYSYINSIGAKFKSQALASPYDVMTVTLDGQEQVIYFDASIVLEAERRLFDAKDTSGKKDESNPAKTP
jgi:hypothetical protein